MAEGRGKEKGYGSISPSAHADQRPILHQATLMRVKAIRTTHSYSSVPPILSVTTTNR